MMSTSNHTASRWLKSNHLGFLESRISTESLVATSRKWVEECTGCLEMDKNFIEYLQDGVVLCELMQSLVPGMIRKKINRIRNPFAWRENIAVFLGACSKLGLRECLLFAPEDIIATTSSNLYTTKSCGVPSSEKILRKVALTISSLALELQSQHGYSGPRIQLGQLGTGRPQPLNLSPVESQCSSDQEDPPLPSPASFSSSLSSPLGSKTVRRVESVTSLITETSSTDIQSYAELVLYRNGSNKEYTCVSKPAPIRQTQSFNRVSYSNKTRVHRTLSDRTPFTAAKLPPDLLQESVSDIDIPTLQNGVGAEFDGSRESFEEEGEYPEYRDFDSTTTPSDASTVIFRELLSSRCSSNLPVPGEECLQGVYSTGGSYDNSPITSRHTVVAGDEEGTDLSSPQIQRYSVNTNSKKASEGGSTSPEIGSKETSANSHEGDRILDRIIGGTNHQVAVSEVTDNSLGVKDQELTAYANKKSAVVENGSEVGSEKKLSTEQVTDIYTSKLNHTHSSAEGTADSEESDLFVSGEQSLEHGKKMEYDSHYQHSGGHVVDSEPIGMNGVRTHGYASNDSKAGVVYSNTPSTTSAGEVPHHSLTLALSDPESPSSTQVPDNDSSNSRHQNFDVSSLTSLKNKTMVHVGTLDVSRVQSDALPHSLLPSMVLCESGEAAPPRMLADARSIDTCSTDDMDVMSATSSPRHLGSPFHAEATLR